MTRAFSFAVLLVAVLLVLVPAQTAPADGQNEAFIPQNEHAAVNGVRALNSNVYRFRYRTSQPDRGFPVSLVDLGPGGEKLIDEALAAGKRDGYLFVLIPGRPNESGKVTTYTVLARPQLYGQTGMRSFYTDQVGIIRETTENRDATAGDPPIQ